MEAPVTTQKALAGGAGAVCALSSSGSSVKLTSSSTVCKRQLDPLICLAANNVDATKRSRACLYRADGHTGNYKTSKPTEGFSGCWH